MAPKRLAVRRVWGGLGDMWSSDMNRQTWFREKIKATKITHYYCADCWTRNNNRMKDSGEVVETAEGDDTRKPCEGPGCGRELLGQRGEDWFREKFKKTKKEHCYCSLCWHRSNTVSESH